MRHQGTILCAVALGAAGLFAQASAQETAGRQARAIGARIIEIEGRAEARIPAGEGRALTAGDNLDFGEDLVLPAGSKVTLAMSDRTLREFTGPATLTLRPDAGPEGGTTLGNLTAALAAMLFGDKVRTSDVVMATRSVEVDPGAIISVPCLLEPAPGEKLQDVPRRFRWMAVEDVPLYRVSVYDRSAMMWQTTSAETEVRCPAKICEFEPGGSYYWVVEALIGNAMLRSQAAAFAVASPEDRSALALALQESDAAVSGADAALALKVRLCLDSQAYTVAHDLLDAALAGRPSRGAYAFRAEVHRRMGLTQDALDDFRSAVATPAGD